MTEAEWLSSTDPGPMVDFALWRILPARFACNQGRGGRSVEDAEVLKQDADPEDWMT